MLRKVWASLVVPANLCRAFHNVRLSITSEFRLEGLRLQIDRNKAAELQVIEEEIDEIIASADLQPILTGDKREAYDFVNPVWPTSMLSFGPGHFSF